MLELSLRGGKFRGDRHIETEHVLLGLICEGEGVAVQVLDRLGVDLIELRQAVIEAAGPTKVHGFQGSTTWTGNQSFGAPDAVPRSIWLASRRSYRSAWSAATTTHGSAFT